MSKSVFTTDAAAELRGRVQFGKKVLGKGKDKTASASWGAMDKINVFDWEVVANTNSKWTGVLDVETKNGQIRSKIEFKSLEGEDCVIPAAKAQEAIAKGKKAIDLPLITESARKEAVKATVAVSTALNVSLGKTRAGAALQNVQNWKEVDKTVGTLLKTRTLPTDNLYENSIEWMVEEEGREEPSDAAAAKAGGEILTDQVKRYQLAQQAYMKAALVTASADLQKIMKEHGVLKWTQNFLNKKDFFEEETTDRGEERKYDRISKILHANNPEKRLGITIEEIKAGILPTQAIIGLKDIFKEENEELLYGSTDKEFIKKAERLITLPLGVRVTSLTKGKKAFESKTKFFAGVIQRTLGIIESVHHEETCDEFGPAKDWFMPLLPTAEATALKAKLDTLVKDTGKGKVPDKQVINLEIWKAIAAHKTVFLERLQGTKGFKGPRLEETGNQSLKEKICSLMNVSNAIITKEAEFQNNMFGFVAETKVPVQIKWSEMTNKSGEGKKTFELIHGSIKNRMVEQAHDPRDFARIEKSFEIVEESIETAYNRQCEMAKKKGRPIPDEMVKEKMWSEVFKLRSRAEVQWFALCLFHRQVAFKKSVLKTDYKLVDDDEEIDWDAVS